ncbi:hypothetical protein ACN47E_008760 [Coniothyrium glycines]
MASSIDPSNRKSSLASTAWYIFRLGFGLFSLLGLWLSVAVKNGELRARDTEEEKQELAAAQKKFWSLDREPLPGFQHAFFKTRTGISLHYIVNSRSGSSTMPKNVAVFIHGFPDSFVLWRHVLQSSELLRHHVIVAVDLPGYGGSDSLPAYGPYEVLETLTEFILGIRAQFLQENKRVVVVTHDWGALIGARLAAEARGLADHWVITSGIIPPLTASNAQSKFLLAKQMLRTWKSSPLSIGLLKNGLNALKPVIGQFKRSFYIFCFNLPWPLTNTFATFGNYWFLRVLHDLGKGPRSRSDNQGKAVSRLSIKEAGEFMAISTGPGLAQLQQYGDLKYGESVRKRLGDRGMSEKIRLYREGLFLGEWQKSLEITAALYELSSTTTDSFLSHTAPKGSLKAPATFILGEHDPAFDKRLALDNARDYLAKGSQVLMVKDAGHWLPLEPTGRRVLEKTVLWALRDRATATQGEQTPFATMSDVKIIERI